ncbi:siderophore-iron reductase FhuF [Pseudomonas alkylphenolica]|uniref:siderophore-iron reductase FhuF n=1 Tax=Pseudomonas alkylphenolica TaxID=237609 RepID=UPI0018D9C49B|nr:siderophore-iron reductase FhuF [Pseudomonas alkylphenolica]MBH3430968.1 siderophore-iron reductase FhuF [Pseudomonas alkylphenolica]
MSESLRLEQLLQPQRFDRLLLELYGAELMPAQRPVLVSQWSKYYFGLVWQTLLCGAALSVFDVTEVTLDARGLPIALAGRGDYCVGNQALLAQHFNPVVSRLAALGGLAPGVVWGNAGDCLDQALARIGGDACHGLGYWLSSAESPMHAAVGLDAEGKRRRRTCCLSYKVDWVGHCEHCPLLV